MTEQHERKKSKGKYTTVSGKQRDDFSEDAELEKQLSSGPQELRASTWTRHKAFYTTLLLLVIVGGIMVVVIPRYTRSNENSDNSDMQDVWTEDGSWDNDDKTIQLRSGSAYRKSKTPKDLGHMNVYIRKPSDDGARRPPEPLRFPVARYNRQEFPLNGPFLSLSPWIPTFVDRRTRQTIIYSPAGGVYIIPPLINFYGDMFSVGELLKYGYASLVSSGVPPVGPINMLPYFIPTPLIGPDLPRINPMTGGFRGGVRTKYENFNIPSSDDYPPYEPEEQEEEGQENDDDSYKPRPYPQRQYKKPYSRPSKYGNKPYTQKNASSYNRVVPPKFDFCQRNYVDKLKRKYLTSKVPNITITKDIDNDNEDLNDTTRLDNCGCQKAILTPTELFEHGLFIILHLTKEDDSSVKKACRKLPRLKTTLMELNPGYNIETTIGIGYDKTREWLTKANIPFPKTFIPFKEKRGPSGMVMPSTGGDILVDIRSTRKDLCFELGRQFYNLIYGTSIAKLDDTFGFGYMSNKQTGLGKDFIGFEDGNDNPEGYTARADTALIINDDDILKGGSFAFTQKWLHNLNKFNKMTVQQQIDVVGRTKGDFSVEIEPKLKTSHIGHVHLEKNGTEIQILRKSLPWGALEHHGLFFISFAGTIDQHEMQLNSMVGKLTGIHDHLMNFTRPLTGNYWFIPSIKVLKRLFYYDDSANLYSSDPWYGSVNY